jgi:hypothetical protein
MNESVTLSRTIQTPLKALYRAITTPAGLMDWCAETAVIGLREGGTLFLTGDPGYRLLGEVESFQEDQSCSWAVTAPFSGQIQFKLRPGEKGVQLSMIFSMEGDLDAQLNYWNPALNNLKSVLETGLDRRVYDRPMLGVLIGGMLDGDTQERFNAPEPYGVFISGTIAGMGAAEIGLLENDVLIELDGVTLKNYQAINRAMSGHKSGDVVPVVWYRDGERFERELTLSGRPEPYVPPTPSELAEYVGGIYRRMDAELAEILEDVSETEADYRPAEREWNAREILAHVILNERAAQLWIGSRLDGHPLESWSSNEHGQVKAVVDVYPTLPELQAEIRRTEDQTVAMLRRLPSDIVTHRGVYVNIVTMFGKHGMPVHTRMHYETLRNQVRVAREKLPAKAAV